MKRNIFVICLTVLTSVALFGANTAFGHEFILKPVALKTVPGGVLPFSVVSAHMFMVSEEMEPPDQVKVQLMGKTESEPVELKPNEMLMTLDGQVKPKSEGTYILAGHRAGMIWTQTTQGWKQASKKGLTGVLGSGLYEKFGKTVITCGKSDDNYAKVVGHALEIVPVSDPSQARVGDYIAFKVLFNGQPLSTEVWATYDGFVDIPNTYAYFTETNGDNLALVKITHPGTWMLRVQKVNPKGTEDYDKHVMRAVLVFEVK